MDRGEEFFKACVAVFHFGGDFVDGVPFGFWFWVVCEPDGGEVGFDQYFRGHAFIGVMAHLVGVVFFECVFSFGVVDEVVLFFPCLDAWNEKIAVEFEAEFCDGIGCFFVTDGHKVLDVVGDGVEPVLHFGFVEVRGFMEDDAVEGDRFFIIP